MFKSLKRKNSKEKKGTKKQSGGNAPSCIKEVDTDKYMSSCHTANLHNKIEDMNYDLISGVGTMPSKQQGGADCDTHNKQQGGANCDTHNKQQGGANCDTHNKQQGGADCNVTSEQKGLMTFTDYLNQTSKYLDGVSSNFDTTTLETEVATADGMSQSGGSGFSINPEEMIGGLPGRAKYDSCCQPALIDGKLTQGKDTQALCGHQMGGKRKRSKSSKTSKKGNKGNKDNKGKKGKVRRKGKGKTLKGGYPGKYPFKGENSNFDDNPQGKDFEGKQPYWSPETR